MNFGAISVVWGTFLSVIPPIGLPFDFKDPKGISAVSLSLDSPLEPIVGYAKGISGSLLFDPAHPERASGSVSVDASSVQFANDGYTATAQGYALNAKRWPQLTLALRKVVSVRRISPTRYSGVVLADFTCRGIVRPKRLEVTADYLPGRAEERTNGRFKGDLMVLRTHFSVSRKEHGISEGIPDAMVGDSIEVGVAVVGIHYAEATAPSEPIKTKDISPAPKTVETPLATALPRIGPGVPLSLDAVRGKGNLVVFFLNEQCGVTVFYKDRLRRLERDFAPLGFAFAAVRTGRKEDPSKSVELPERAYLKMPFLDDAHGTLMRAYGIGQSLTFAVIDHAGQLRYLGGFDDRVEESKVNRTPLRDALRAVAVGRPVRVPRAPAIGCAILPVER